MQNYLPKPVDRTRANTPHGAMELRDRLRTLLGNQQLSIADVDTEGIDLQITFSDGIQTRGYLLAPRNAAPHPAVLYCHAHGNTYGIGRDELLHGRPALQGPYGPRLQDAGFAVLSIDLPCFGSRSHQDEAIVARQGLWHGKPLFGRMLAELSACFRWLQARPEITGIGTLGLSMGATHAFWLAALEPQIAACAHIACFADLATLVETGEDRLHAPYMTVPGLLPTARTGEIAGLVAPRPQLLCASPADPLTPPRALERGLSDLRAAYARTPDRLTVHLDPTIGHAESAEMRCTVLKFLTTALR